MATATEFMKLEKIELGGIKGKRLSALVVQIFEEFNELYKVFTEKSYDSLDPQDNVSSVESYLSLVFKYSLLTST